MPTSATFQLARQLFSRPKPLKTVIFFITSACNARCRTCFYWEQLNRRDDLTWSEIQKLSSTMPRFTDLWLSGGEPMLRRELADIVHLFCAANGVRWVNLPTNGLVPARTAACIRRILGENPELRLDLNVALDGLGETHDSIRAVPGNFAKALETLDAVQPCRRDYPQLRVNINTVICAANFEQVRDIAEFVKTRCRVDGHYFNIIRGNALDPSLKKVPADRLEALYRELRGVYHHYAPGASARDRGLGSFAGRFYYEATLAFHNRVQLDNANSPHRWPMSCTAGETAIVIDANGDLRACELRGSLGNVRDTDCDFAKFWSNPARSRELDQIVSDQCWCTHVCFIHDSMRHSLKATLYDVPLAYLKSRTPA